MADQLDPRTARLILAARGEPQLEREDERRLTELWFLFGDRSSCDVLARSHMRHVVAVATMLGRHRQDLDEMVAAGSLGLARALMREKDPAAGINSVFDPSRGNRFLTFAVWWIRSAIMQHIVTSWNVMSGGKGAFRTGRVYKLLRARNKAACAGKEGEDAVAHVASTLGVRPGLAGYLLEHLGARPVPLDGLQQGDERSRAPGPNPEEAMIARQWSAEVRRWAARALARLDDRERTIVEGRLMTDEEDVRALAEIGAQMGLSRERVRQLEVRARRRMAAAGLRP